MKAFLHRHRLVAFFVLAFVLSWYPWIIALALGRTSGPNPLGPLVAAIIVTALVYGRPGLRQFFGRLVRGRVGIKWYVIAFGVPVLICLAAAGITLGLVPGNPVSPLTTAKLAEVPERFIFTLLFVALGEEPGWRGFALPELQSKQPPMTASLILAAIWATWHLPLIGNEFPLPIVVPFIISVFGGTFMLTYVFNGTRGSVFLPMLLHATINTLGAGLIYPLFSRTRLLVLWWIHSLLWLAVGLFALIRSKAAPVLPNPQHRAPLGSQSGISGSTSFVSKISDSCQPR